MVYELIMTFKVENKLISWKVSGENGLMKNKPK